MDPSPGQTLPSLITDSIPLGTGGPARSETRCLFGFRRCYPSSFAVCLDSGAGRDRLCGFLWSGEQEGGEDRCPKNGGTTTRETPAGIL
jgi:hypothetical protein